MENRVIRTGVKFRTEADRPLADRVTEQLRRDVTAACDRAGGGALEQFRAAEDAFEAAARRVEGGRVTEVWAEVDGAEGGKFVRREFVREI